MIRCTECEHLNEAGAVFCTECHHFLAWATPDAGGEAKTARAVDPVPGTTIEEPLVAEPSVAGPTPGPVALRKVVDAVAASDHLIDRRDRTDLAKRLDDVRSMVEHRAHTVTVVGEFKRGKSTLVNALLQTAVCPVDADTVTGLPTLVRYGKALGVVAHVQRAGDLDESTYEARFEELESLVAERGGDRVDDVRSVEVGLPHRMLRTGLRLLDTPGVGGLESVHGQLGLTGLNSADGVLFVTDASQELTRPELEYLTASVARCARAALVVTKTDLHQHWRRIVEANRHHLDNAGLALPVFPVSSFLRLRATRQPSLNEESGFGPLLEFLAAVLERGAALQAATMAHEVDFVAAQLAHEADVERVVIAIPEQRDAVIGRLDDVDRRARALSAPSAAWQQVLADGIQDLVSDVEYDLAARLRTVMRDARDIIDESDPKDTWVDTQTWLRRQVAEAGVANHDLLLRRANDLSDSVARQFEFESGTGVELEFASVSDALAALELPSASTFVMPGGRLSSMLSSGRLAAYVPLVALGVAMQTTLFILPPAALAGALIGRKLFQMEGTRQRSYRQGQAKAAAGTFVDEVAFEMNKDTRDGLRRTQRRLRDEFQSRASSIRVSTGAALAIARDAAALPPTAQAARAAQLDEETRELSQIRRHMQLLTTVGVG